MAATCRGVGKKHLSNPVKVQQGFVVQGGSLSEPMVLPDIHTSTDGKSFVKVNKATKWLCLFATGASSGRRPLAHCGIFSLIRQRVVAAGMELASQNGATSAISALGLEGPQGRQDQLDRISRNHRTRPRPTRDWVEVRVPETPGGRADRTIEVLTKSPRDCAWVRVSDDVLHWLREYVRVEIVMAADPDTTQTTEPSGTTAAPESGQRPEPSQTPESPQRPEPSQTLETPEKPPNPARKAIQGFWFCKANSEWRFSVTDSNGRLAKNGKAKKMVKSLYVARLPEHDFQARSMDAKKDAREKRRRLTALGLYTRDQVYGRPLEPTPYDAGRTDLRLIGSDLATV